MCGEHVLKHCLRFCVRVCRPSLLKSRKLNSSKSPSELTASLPSSPNGKRSPLKGQSTFFPDESALSIVVEKDGLDDLDDGPPLYDWLYLPLIDVFVTRMMML